MMVDSLAEVSASRVTARHPECGSMGNSRLVAKLRQKIESDPRHPRYVKTVRGAGYLLAKES